MKVTCHSCGAKYAIADDKVRGRRVKVRCKSCSTPIVVDGYALDADMEAAALGGDDDEATRVAPGLSGAADSDAWSVNLSDTDQRSMTSDEIVEGWHSGLIREDAFVWKDGMDDWKPVLEVPELASRFFERRPSSPASAPAPAPAASPFGRPAPAWEPPAADPAPAAFGAGANFGLGGAPARPASAARVAGGRAQGADLFGGVEQAGSEEEARQSSRPSAAPGATPYAEAKPTGARNENSVLFSLDALKAGFTPAAQAAPGPKKPSADTGGAANLDDLMSIGGGGASPLFGLGTNQALLHAPPPPEPPPPPPPAAEIPGAPASLVPSYAPAAPPSKSNKLIFAIGGAVALLLVVGAGLAVVVAGGGDDKDKVAKLDDDKKDDDKKSATDSESKKEESKKDSEEKKDEAAEAKKDEASEEKKDEASEEKKDPGAPVSEEDKKRFAEAMKKKQEEETAEKKKEPEKKEEVVKKDQPSSGVGSFNKGAAISALSSAASAASGCKRPGGPTGSGRAIVTFAPSGRVTSANISGGSFGGTSVGGCIASVFRRAKVPPFDGGPVTVSKSFNIAP